MTTYKTTIDFCYGLHDDGTPYFRYKDIVTNTADFEGYDDEMVQEIHDLEVKLAIANSDYNRGAEQDDDLFCKIHDIAAALSNY